MVVTGVSIDVDLRAAKARLRGDPRPSYAARVAELLALRDYYRSSVYARFDLDSERQVSLATALHYAKLARVPRRSRLRQQIADARRLKLTVEAP